MAQSAASDHLLTDAAPPSTQYQSQSYLQLSLRRLRRQRGAMLALGVLVVVCLVTLLSPWIDANVLHLDPNQGVPPSLRFRSAGARTRVLGTDDFGRDQLARLLVAGRVSLAIGFMVAAISLTFGVAVGDYCGLLSRVSSTMPSTPSFSSSSTFRCFSY